MESERLIRTAVGFGSISFFSSAIIFSLPPLLLPKYFNEDKWKVYKEILNIVSILLLISLINYIYAAQMGFITFSLKGFFNMFFWTFALGAIVVFALVNFKTNLMLKKHLEQARKMNHQIQNKKITPSETDQNQLILLESEIAKQSIQINSSSLIYITSIGNYLEYHYLDESGQIQFGKIRNRMKLIEEKLSRHPAFFRCHRAFIINKDFIKAIKGNTKGYILTLEHLDTDIPVARSKSSKLKAILS